MTVSDIALKYNSQDMEVNARHYSFTWKIQKWQTGVAQMALNVNLNGCAGI